MRHSKTMLGAVVILAGLATSAQAQFGLGAVGGNAFGYNGGFGYGNTGFGYANSGFGYGNGIGVGNGIGYGRGYYSNGAIPSYYVPPTTYNNLGGLAGAITTHTGKANSYRYGYGQYPGRRR